MGRPRSFDRDVALEQAMRLFWEKGYDETSIGDLTAAMGIAAPSLYAAFGDKRALFEEAVELYERLPGAPITAGDGEPTAFGAVARDPRERGPGVRRAGPAQGLPDPRRAAAGRARAASCEAIRERLLEGAEELPEGTDVDALASYVSAVLAGMSSAPRRGDA